MSDILSSFNLLNQISFRYCGTKLLNYFNYLTSLKALSKIKLLLLLLLLKNVKSCVQK